MIIKSLPIKTEFFHDILAYVARDKNRSIPGEPFALYNNLSSIDIEDMAIEFGRNTEFLDVRAENTGYQEILAWNREDTKKLSFEDMQQFAEEYIKVRGENALCYCQPHVSSDKWHLHLIFSGAEYSRKKSLNLNNQEFYEVRRKMETFRQKHFPHLDKVRYRESPYREMAIQPKEKTTETHRETQMKKRLGKSETKKQLYKRLLLEIADKCDSLQAFRKAIAKTKEFSFYKQNGKTKGIRLESGQKFRFTNLQFFHPYIEQLQRREELSRFSEQNLHREQSNYLNR